MSITETLGAIWDQILEITTLFVIPDWGAIIGLMPILIFLGVVGPLLTFTILGVMGYQIAKPRTKVQFRRGPTSGRPRRGRRARLPARPALLPTRRARLRARDDDLRALRRRARGGLPDVRPGSDGRHRHLRQLRPRPQGQGPPGPGPHDVRPPAWRRGGRLTGPSATTGPGSVPRGDDDGRTLQRPLPHRRAVRRPGLRRLRSGHAVMLANGRRSVAALAPAAQPSTGVRRRRDRLVRHRSQPGAGRWPDLGRLAQPVVAGRDVADGHRRRRPRGLAGAARHRRRTRAVGQHVRVHGRLLVLDRDRLPHPGPTLRHRLDRLHPDRRRARPAAVRVEPAVRDLAARPRPPEPAAADHPCRDGRPAYGIFATAFAAGVGYLVQGQGDRYRVAALAQGPRRGRLQGGDHRLPGLRRR